MRPTELIVKAASMAATAHASQTRIGIPEPYINHPLRVAVTADECGLNDEVVAAALLHDVIEDTSMTMHLLAHCGFPSRTLMLVDLLSKWWDTQKMERELTPAAFRAFCARVVNEFKPKYYSRILMDQDAVVLKILDRADNMQDMVLCAHEKRAWAEKYLLKTDREFPILLMECRSPKALTFFTEGRDKLVAALATAPMIRES